MTPAWLFENLKGTENSQEYHHMVWLGDGGRKPPKLKRSIHDSFAINNEINVLEYCVTFIGNGHDDLSQLHDDLAEKTPKKGYLKQFYAGLPIINVGS